MTEQRHKTSGNLDAPTYAAWRASGLTLNDAVQRGIDGTGDTARYAAIEQRLAFVEARMALLESRAATIDLGTPEPYEGRTPEQVEADWVAARAERLTRLHSALWDATLPGADGDRAVTVADVQAVTGSTPDTSRSSMHGIASQGLATQHARKAGTGTPYRWTLHPPASAPSPADTGT